MVALGKREKTLAAAFGTFILILMADKVVIGPFAARLDGLANEIDAGEMKLAKLMSINYAKDNITASYSLMKPYMETAGTEEGSLSVIMKKVEEMAIRCRITLLNMKPVSDPVLKKEDHIIKKTELSIEGSQSNIVKFLYIIENSGYPLVVNSVDFKVKDRDKNLMAADIDIYFLYFL
jgi:hypothetical protein